MLEKATDSFGDHQVRCGGIEIASTGMIASGETLFSAAQSAALGPRKEVLPEMHMENVAGDKGEETK